MVAPWDYRTGDVSYFLRTQLTTTSTSRYRNFMQERTVHGTVSCGIPGSITNAVAQKYELEDELNEKTAERDKAHQGD